MDVVIGLDCGTSATKAVAAGLDCTVRATASEAYPLLVPAPGRAELDPVVLQAAVVRALAGVAAAVQARGDHVVGVCLSAAMHGTLPMGEDGSPLGPLATWRAPACPSAGAGRGRGRRRPGTLPRPQHARPPRSPANVRSHESRPPGEKPEGRTEARGATPLEQSRCSVVRVGSG